MNSLSEVTYSRVLSVFVGFFRAREAIFWKSLLSEMYINVGPPLEIPVESGELCFSLNGFYH